MKNWSIPRIIAFLIVGFATWWTTRQCSRGAYLMFEFTDNRFIQTTAYFVVHVTMMPLILVYVGLPVAAFIETILTQNKQK